jgi:hypothetical protein
LTEATVELGKCQVGSGTAQPCLQPAVVKIQGIPFCESCAREQEAYFTIGELTEDSRNPEDNRSLVEGMLEEQIWWIRHRRVVAGEQEESSAAA